VLSIIQSLNNL